MERGLRIAWGSEMRMDPERNCLTVLLFILILHKPIGYVNHAYGNEPYID